MNACHARRVLISGVDGVGLDVLNLVDIRGESNYELAMRLQTSVANDDGEFYTDLNGFQAGSSTLPLSDDLLALNAALAISLGDLLGPPDSTVNLGSGH